MNFTTNRTVDGAPAIQQGSGVPPAFHPQIVRSVRMHPGLAAVVGGCVFLVLLGYGLTRKPSYKAESLVYEEPAAAKLLSDGTAGSFDPSRYDSYLDQQKQIITRPDVLRAAIATLPKSVWQELGPNEEAAVGSLQAQVKADRVKTSYQLSIDLESHDPVAAAAIVNAVTKSYLDAVHKDTAAQSDQRVLLLAEERNRIEGELDTTRHEQARLSASLGVASPGGEAANPYDFEIAGVRQQLLTAREAHDVAGAQLNSISGDTALTNAANEAIFGDPALAGMRATVSSRRAALNEQMAGMKPENPVYRQDLAELADLDKTLETMTIQLRAKAERQLQEKLRTDLERTGDIESRMNAQLARLTATATTAAPRLQRATELSQDLTRLNTRYAAVDDALRSLQLEANGPGVVRLSLAASVPTTPEPNRKMLLLAAAPIFGAIFGIAAAVFARKRDRHVYSPRDVEDILGFAPMAVLPAKEDVSPRVMEEYVLRFAAGLESAYRGTGAQTFLLTAASAATDVRPLRKALTAKLERIGLDVSVASTTDLLLADPEITSDPGHSMARHGDGEGFVSGHLARLKCEHALVIISAPPLGTSAETEYVARCADATILVAESGVTTHEELFESARLLQRLDAKGVGTVLQGLQLRLASESFRQAVAAVEQRQPESYNSPPRAKAVVVESATEAAEFDYVTPHQRPAAGPQSAAIAFPYQWVSNAAEPVIEAAQPTVVAMPQPAIVEPAVAMPHPAVAEPAAVLEDLVKPETLAAEALPQVFAEPVIEVVRQPTVVTIPHPAIAEPAAVTEELATPEAVAIEELPQIPAKPVIEAVHEPTVVAMLQPAMAEPVAVAEDRAMPEPKAAEELPQIFAEPQGLRLVEPLYEKKAPKLSVSQETLADKDTPKNWFRRLLRRNDKKVSIFPDGDDDGAHFLTARISRNVPAYAASAVRDEPRFERSAEQPSSRRFMFDDLQIIHQETEPEVEAVLLSPDAAVAEAEVETAQPFVALPPQEIVPTPAMSVLEPMTAAADIQETAMDEMSSTQLLSRLKPRPARPLSFHELTARAEHGESEATPVSEVVASEIIGAEKVHAVELPQELPEVQAAEPLVEERSMEEPAAATEIVTGNDLESHVEEDQSGAITKEIARIASGVHNGTSRWDPIPPLRPTDSGWNRVHAISNGNGSNRSEYMGVERRRSAERSSTGRESEMPPDLEAGAQRWAEQAAAAELDEPSLSRPWGLLSRFQQAHMITPDRRNGATNGASGNGSGAEDHDRELETGSVRTNRNG